LYLAASINGQHARFLVSSDERSTILDLRQFDVLGLSTREVFGSFLRPQDARGFTKVGSLKIGDSAELGKFTVLAEDFQSRNDREIARKLPAIQGTLGAECLQAWAAVIDFSTPAVFLRRTVTP
jgi:hypothetical protein